jgi:hypothetical protein
MRCSTTARTDAYAWRSVPTPDLSPVPSRHVAGGHRRAGDGAVGGLRKEVQREAEERGRVVLLWNATLG